MVSCYVLIVDLLLILGDGVTVGLSLSKHNPKAHESEQTKNRMRVFSLVDSVMCVPNIHTYFFHFNGLLSEPLSGCVYARLTCTTAS